MIRLVRTVAIIKYQEKEEVEIYEEKNNQSINGSYAYWFDDIRMFC